MFIIKIDTYFIPAYAQQVTNSMKFSLFLKYVIVVFCLSSFTIGKAASFDNILKVLFYTENNQEYLILHESLYHVTAGAYKQGNMISQGYNSSRISVFNLQTGHIIAQKDMGPIDSASACVVLGCSPGNLWIYHQKYKSGLQSLNPVTLNRGTSQAKIYNNLKTSIGRFINPEWNNISSYYAFDEIQQKLIVTNTNKQQFYLDIESFTTEPIKDALKPNNEEEKFMVSEVVFKDSVWKLDGYDLLHFKSRTIEVAEPEFLFGQFILEKNKMRLFHFFYNLQENISNIDRPLSEKEQNILEKSQANIKKLIEGEKPDEVLLQPNTNSFFVFSRESKSADALVKISKINSEQFGYFNEVWSVSPPAMFYNVASARNTSKFKKYFGDVYPEFEYKFIQMHNNKLVIIYLLHICCIDINTGDILWYNKLK